MRYTPAQCADVPLAFYVLLAVSSLSEGVTTRARAPWVMAGVAAGLAAWTKNEGLVFCLLIIAAAVLAPHLDQTRSRAARCGYVLAGTAPMLGALLVLKLITPSTDLVAAGTFSSTVSHLPGPTIRWQTVAGRFWRELWYSGASVIGGAAGSHRLRRPERSEKAHPGGPGGRTHDRWRPDRLLRAGLRHHAQDLAWHLNTSVDRVLLHVYPAAIWCAMMLVRS